MGPQNEAILCESSPVKEPSWIDRMYQKLESVCVEVDKDPSVFLQETTKYVEVQMNAVGSNMKKFCTELIQDLLPPSAVSSDETIKGLNLSLEHGFESICSRKVKQTGSDAIPELSIGPECQNKTPSLTDHDVNFVCKNSCVLEETALQEDGTEEEDCQKEGCSVQKLAEQEKVTVKEGCQQDGSDFDERVDCGFKGRLACSLHGSDEKGITDAEFSGWFKNNHCCESDKARPGEEEEDQEQWAWWYPTEGIRELSSSSSTNFSDKDLQDGACQEELDSEWELI